MKRAEQMYQYCKDNKFGSGMTDNWGIKHFKLIEDNLMPDEHVLIAFMGLHNYESLTKHNNNYAYAITNKRILMGQKKVLGERLKTILPKDLNNVEYEIKGAVGVLTFYTEEEKFNVAVEKDDVKHIYDSIHTNLFSNKQLG